MPPKAKDLLCSSTWRERGRISLCGAAGRTHSKQSTGTSSGRWTPHPGVLQALGPFQGGQRCSQASKGPVVYYCAITKPT